MPIYEYYCGACKHKYDSMRPMAKRDDSAPCPKCGQSGERQLSAFGFKYEGPLLHGFSRRAEADGPSLG